MTEINIFKELNYNVFFKELEYYVKYYGNEFKPMQGLEHIIHILKKYTNEGSWMDLGGGSNTSFWRMAFPRLNNIVSIDINKEAFFLSELIIKYFKKSPCMLKVEQLIGDHANLNDNTKISYIQADLLKQNIESNERYNNITQFGLLGLINSEYEFKRKSNEIINLLEDQGIYIGVNWIFSNTYALQKGFNNSFINTKLIKEVVDENSVDLLYCKEHDILNDENYTQLVLYVLKKRRVND